MSDDPTENDPDEKPRRERGFVFKQPVSKLYPIFVQSTIPIFESYLIFDRSFDL